MTRFAIPADHPSGLGRVQDVIVPRSRDLGEMTVHRALPHRQRKMVGPFIFFDQMGPASFGPDEGIAVRPHPHIGLSTVTYLFDGVIRHRDSLGTVQDIEPGAVNWMTAGRGISHSERAPEELRGQAGEALRGQAGEALRGQAKTVFGIQTWLALPQSQEDAEPDFVHVPASGLPAYEGEGLDLRVVMGTAWGTRAPAAGHTDTLYVDARMAAGARLPVPGDHEDRAVYVVEGMAEIGGQPHEAGRMAVLADGPAALTAGPRGARVMLLGGAVADGPRHIWWNFVASSKERIDAAKEAWAKGDWEGGMFSLPPGDDEEFIPVPQGEPSGKASFYP